MLKIRRQTMWQVNICGTCHDGSKEVGGVKVFGWQEGSDCTKCHKKAEVPAPEQPKEPAPEQPAK